MRMDYVSSARPSPFCSTRPKNEKPTAEGDDAEQFRGKTLAKCDKRVSAGRGGGAKMGSDHDRSRPWTGKNVRERFLPVLLRVLAIFYRVSATATAALSITVLLEILLRYILTKVLLLLLVDHCLCCLNYTRCINGERK